MKYSAIVYSAQQAAGLFSDLQMQVRPWLMAGHRLEVVVRPVKRSTEQNAKLHAELQEIAERVEWAGKKHSVDTWKRLLTASWLRTRGESVEVLPALDGHGIDVVFRHTSELTTAEMTDLIEYVLAWKAMEEA